MSARALFAWSLSVCLFLSAGSVLAQGTEAGIEEIRVTGSYIKRDNFDSPSPVNVIDALDITATGTTNTADLIFNLPQNVGTEVLANPFASGPSASSTRTGGNVQGGVGLPNLRGLGPRSTMTLMDGHRLVFGDSNFVYPQIAIQRIEILLDGASALYGSDAIAGVVNFIPYKRFDGMKVQVERRDQLAASAPDDKVSLLAGFDGDRGNFLFAFEWRERERLQQSEFPRYLRKSYEQNVAVNNGFPGSAFLPRRNAAGTITNNAALAANQRPDPGCGFDFLDPGSDPLVAGHDRWGVPSPNGRACGTNWSEWMDWNSDLSQQHGYSRFDYEIVDGLRFNADVMFGRQDFNTRAPASPRVLNAPLRVPGDLPGNPFRAYSNTTALANFLNPAGTPTSQLLYAQDNCNFVDCSGGDGLPDRGHNGVAVPSLQGVWGAPVLLAPNQFAPRAFDPTNPNATVDPDNGGIPFFEDVTLNNWTPFGKNIAGMPSAAFDDGSIPRRRKTDNLRLSGGFEYEIPNTSWAVDVLGIYGRREQTYALAFGSPSNFSATQLQAAFNCVNPADVAANRCTPFNPFSTSQFQVINGVPQPVATDPSDPAYNSTAVANSIFTFHDDVVVSTQKIVDLVATGNVYRLPAGEIGAAVGVSLRRQELEIRPNALNLTSTQVFGTAIQPQDGYIESVDWFGELRVPVIDHALTGLVELQLAARQTNNEAEAKRGLATDASFDDTVRKAAVLWQPRDWISLRASWGEGFVVPELGDMFQGRRDALRQGTDPTCTVLMPIELPFPEGQELCNYGTVGGNRVVLANPQVESIQGNPDLNPESSTARNVGFTLNLFDRSLSLQADYFTVDYDDVIFGLTFQTLAGVEQKRFSDYYLERCGASPSVACATQARTDWIVGGLETPRYTREIDPVSGQPIGPIRELRADFVNLLSQKVTAIDYAINYRFDPSQYRWGGNWGLFNVRLQATQMQKYTFQIDPLSPVIRGEGNRNDVGAGSQIPPLPKWRGTAAISWLYGDHFVRLTGRYHSGVNDRNLDGSIRAANSRGKIDASTYWDLYYAYTLNDLFGRRGETSLSLGIQNVFGHQPKPIEDNNGVDTFLDSPLKQIWTLRLGHTF